MENNFETELESLINKFSMENASNTPDFILAEYMKFCLDAFNQAVERREKWYGRDLRPAEKPLSPSPQIYIDNKVTECGHNEVKYFKNFTEAEDFVKDHSIEKGKIFVLDKYKTYDVSKETKIQLELFQSEDTPDAK